jgi:restriction endonuclease S subunit
LYGKLRPYLNKVHLPTFSGICSTDIVVIKPRPIVRRKYLAYILRSPYILIPISNLTYGTKMPRMKISDLQNLEIALPPLEIQDQSINKLDSIMPFLHNRKRELMTLEESKWKKLVTLSKNALNVVIDELISLEDLPSDGQLLKLQDVSRVITDGTHIRPKYVEEGIPFLRVTDINSSEINWAETKKITIKQHESLTRRHSPEEGDVLLSKNGTIGISRVVDWKHPFSIFVSLALIKPKHEVLDSQYLKFFFDSFAAKKQLLSRSKTATVTNLHLEEIRELIVPIPPIKTQKEIVEAIREKEDKILHIRSILQRAKLEFQTLQKKLNVISAAVLSHALAKK